MRYNICNIITSNMMWTSSTYWIFLVILATSSCMEITKDLCMAPNEICINLTNCSFALALVKEEKFDKLKNITCGWEGTKAKVCCPQQMTDYDSSTSTMPLQYSTSESSEEEIQLSTNVKVQRFAYSDRAVCGKEAGYQDRIVGGKIAAPEEFPWLVRLKRKNARGLEMYYCAGSLITDRHVLTAAHCLKGLNLVSVRLGEWNENDDVDCYEVGETMRCHDARIDRKVVSQIIHPDFSSRNNSNDIGIIVLDKPVPFNDFIRPICLPTTSYVQRQGYSTDNVRYETAGWGMTEFGSTSVIKRKVSLNAVSHKLCRNILKTLDSEDNVICAGGEKGKDSCNGDSGGPLVRQVAEDYGINSFLFGITSYGAKDCGVEGRPGVYTRVSNYMDWIKMNVT